MRSDKRKMKYAVVQDGKIYIADEEHWITVRGDDGRGQHVLINENGDIISGLGGKFKNLRELHKNDRNYESGLSKGLGRQHYDAVRRRIEACKNEKFKSFWKSAESKIEVGDAHHTGTSHCSGEKIFVNIDKDADKAEWWKRPYETTIHESGHAIDRAFSPAAGTTFSVRYKNGLFAKTILSEVEERMNEARAELRKYHSNPSRVRAYKEFYTDIQRNYKTIAWGNISDILEAATKGTIGYGHGTDYWRRVDRVHGTNAGLAIEAFAEMTAATAVNPKALAAIKQYLPKSYAVYEEMIEEITKRGQGEK